MEWEYGTEEEWEDFVNGQEIQKEEEPVKKKPRKITVKDLKEYQAYVSKMRYPKEKEKDISAEAFYNEKVFTMNLTLDHLYKELKEAKDSKDNELAIIKQEQMNNTAAEFQLAKDRLKFYQIRNDTYELTEYDLPNQ